MVFYYYDTATLQKNAYNYPGSFRKKAMSTMDVGRPYAVPYYPTHKMAGTGGITFAATGLTVEQILSPKALINEYANAATNPQTA